MESPLVFSDRHHNALTKSLELLFEGRLKGQLYFQKGMEWWEEGYFHVFPHIDTAKQYLERELEGVKGVTLEEFKSMPFDIIVASLPQHIQPFKKLIELYQPQAKLIFQIGNAWSVEADSAPNVMASAVVNNIPSNVNFITYHQEFDLNIFFPTFPSSIEKKISSFVNCFNTADHFQPDWKLFEETEKLMPDWGYKAYGGQCRDGAAHGVMQIAEKMRGSGFIWNTKHGGDGYGHVIFNAAAIGRPLITKKEYYKNKLGEKLMIDGETCIAIDGLSPQEIKNKIEYYSDPEKYHIMCKKTYQNFQDHVDFSKEADNIKIFLENLK